MSSDSVRKKIEALGTQLSLPTVRKALGALEGEHASGRRGGSGDAMDVHAYEPGDESRLIDWKTSARQGRPMVVERERLSTSRVWLLMDVGLEMTGVCPSGERAWQVAANALRMFAALSLRRSDDISLVFGDESSITRAKRLLRSLQENIVRYESNVGKIEIPSPQPTPDAGPKMGQA